MTTKPVTKENHEALLEKLRESVKNVRDIGYAVVYWNPDELKGVDPDSVEEPCVTFGNMIIDRLSFDPNDPSNEAPF